MVATKIVAMSVQEIPIQGGYGARSFAGRLFGIESAALTVVAHAINVATGCDRNEVHHWVGANQPYVDI